MPSIIRIDVDLGPRSYPILVGSGIVESVGATLREYGFRQEQAFILTNATVGGLYAEAVSSALTRAGFGTILRHDIPATEEGKNFDELASAAGALVTGFPDAGAVPLVLLLGGGVVGDLGGFAAAIFRRGVPFVQMPTTLLAAVDSSVGGKLAVNFGGVKNILGVFAQPRLVLCDLTLLRSLPPREMRSGLAEIIKYGAVCSAELFEQLEQGAIEPLLAGRLPALGDIVSQCCRLKAAVVEQDEFDKKGIRNVLNFGHTFGHALELSADYQLTHGEAVAIGMVAATRLARRLEMVDPSFEERLVALIERAGLPRSFPETPGLFDRVMRAMQSDKKFREGRNVFVLPTAIGAWQQKENVEWPLVHEALRSVLVSPQN